MITIYDDLLNEYREFKPIREGFVSMYVCGITAYDSPHIGHARSAVSFDIIRRYLEFHGYEVKFVMNYTDVDDKMIARANEEETTIYEISEKYIKEYEEMQKALRIKPPTVKPRATQEIPDMIKMIQILEEKGYTYESGGSVYFDTSRMEGYKTLFQKKEKINGDDPKGEFGDDEDDSGSEYTQSAFADEKRNIEDFVLWKKEKPGEPSWDSPWGKGRPGWHIECSVMAQKYLGPTIDIHGGGKDLKRPHHQNEIAQSECATGHKFVNYWMHNGFLNINSEKMSKSLGNFFPLMDLLEKASGTLIRYYFATSYYKRPMDFSMDKLDEAKKNLEKIQKFYIQLKEYPTVKADSSPDSQYLLDLQRAEVKKFQDGFLEAMDFDFNSAKAMGFLFALINFMQKKVMNINAALFESVKQDLINFLEDIDNVFQFIVPSSDSKESQEKDSKWKKILDDLIEDLLSWRKEMKKEKQWVIADQIRELVSKHGIKIEDQGIDYKWEFEF
ncbi:MAG: cysteine--tRNA ligase [Promethearchaeota archaeon]